MSNKILIETVTDQQLWEKYLDFFAEANFLQSSAWQNFQRTIGKKTWAIRVYQVKSQNIEQTLALALVVAEKAKRAHYLTIAGGPLIYWKANNSQEILLVLLEYLKKIAKEQKFCFLRLRPQAPTSQEFLELFRQLGFKQAPMHLTADRTLQLDLSLSETTLLAQMRKNTRYEIRRAEKMMIKTKISQDPDEIKAFYEAQLDLARRQNFIPFAYQFLYQQFLAFLQNKQVALIHSYLNDQWLASAFIIFYRREAVYHYGVSSLANAKLPGSYACQWAAIKEAKKRGLDFYNFWGISPPGDNKHRFAGVSLFKRGFGGQEVVYLPAQDYPFSQKYYLVRIFELFRKKIRKL